MSSDYEVSYTSRDMQSSDWPREAREWDEEEVVEAQRVTSERN